MIKGHVKFGYNIWFFFKLNKELDAQKVCKLCEAA